mmetsp:Transcript_5137/g.19318  ORF Transcript_5137/g.19318 Transcript_5137/m.19318 type:complete len:218 (+) Transcript_5137:277-930(+)
MPVLHAEVSSEHLVDPVAVPGEVRRAHLRARVLLQVEPVHVLIPAVVVSVYELVRQHVLHVRPIRQIVVAQHHALVRSEPAQHRRVAPLHLEERAVHRTPSLLQSLEKEPHHRRLPADVVKLGLAFFGGHPVARAASVARGRGFAVRVGGDLPARAPGAAVMLGEIQPRVFSGDVAVDNWHQASEIPNAERVVPPRGLWSFQGSREPVTLELVDRGE